MTIVSPSILSADFTKLGADCQMVLDAGAQMLHYNVMDGHFVPNISFGVPVLKSLHKGMPAAFYDVHLMISHPLAYAEPFAKAGATFVSPFVGRLDDISEDGIHLVKTIADIFAIHDIDTEIIAASIRHPMHVTQAALAGAHIATVPYKVLLSLVNHPLTDAGIARFLADWKQANL